MLLKESEGIQYNSSILVTNSIIRGNKNGYIYIFIIRCYNLFVIVIGFLSYGNRK